MSQVNLMFHDVKLKPNKWNLLPFQFEKYIQIISNLNKENLTITIDDGGVGNYNFIMSILDRYQLKAIFFIPTKFINVNNKFSSNYMNPEQIKTLIENGHLIGSHSHSHPVNFAHLSDEEVEFEWKESKQILENICNIKIENCSIPEGIILKKHFDILEKLGYKRVYTSKPTFQFEKYGQLEIHGRFNIDSKMTIPMFNRILSENKLIQKYLLTLKYIKHRVYLILLKFKIKLY